MKRRSGFTIIELLVAMAVTAVLAGILLTMTNGVLRSWNRTSGSLSSNAEAELIFGLLKDDFQSAISKNDGSSSFVVEVLDNTSALNGRNWTIPTGDFKPAGNISHQHANEAELANTRNGLGGMWIRFFTTAGDGRPQAVAYQLARRKITGDPTLASNKAEERYMLYRSSFSAAATLRNGYDLTDLSSDYMKPNGLRNPPQGDVIGNNVVDFGVRLYYRDPSSSTLEPRFPHNGTDWSNATNYEADGTSGNEFPEVIDVMVRILTKEGAQLIANLENPKITVPLPSNLSFDEYWWQIAEENSRVYTQRIYVNSRSF